MIGMPFCDGSVPRDRLEAERLRATNARSLYPPPRDPDYLFANTPDFEPEHDRDDD